MDLYDINNDIEKRMQERADREFIPVGGTLELLPLCNMSCKMCYVRQTKKEMDAQGRMLSCNEWLGIVRQAVDRGLLFLLLTGGEPLLYPDFKKLYVGLSQMGLVLSVNTNGTLLNEDWVKFFVQNGVRRLSITLYGADDATYDRLCGNPQGFTQLMRAADLLKKNDVPFRFTCSVTPYNVDQLGELYGIAEKYGVALDAATYMFPPARRRVKADNSRLTPVESARAQIRDFRMENKDKDMALTARVTLSKMKLPPRFENCEGFTCHAGKSGFWMNWKGEMLPCGMFNEPKISMLEHSFDTCWDYIVNVCKRIPKCEKCMKCEKQNICMACLAANYTETGSTSGCPEYLCERTDEQIRICEEIAEAHGGKEGPILLSSEEFNDFLKRIKYENQ